MDKRIALTDYIELDGVDLSNSIRALGFSSERPEVDASGFNEDGFDEFLVGNRVIAVEMDVMITRGSGEAWQVLYPLHRDGTEFDLVWRAHGEDAVGATNPELRGSVKLLNFNAGATRGDLEAQTLNFRPSNIANPLEFYAT